MTQRAEAALGCLLLVLAVLVLVAGNSGCATTGTGKETTIGKVDTCKVIGTMTGVDIAGKGISMVVCWAIKDPVKRQRCFQEREKWSGAGSMILNLASDVIKACKL